eukprot:GHVL01009281.1.p1 GENE.GHVL01009281.1~~GHVL01009281.1.p1  ORF type:complete len:273 (-),score=40.54 GHVL01009281.1:1581-2399(-)
MGRVKIGLYGAGGRVGRRLIALAVRDADFFEIVGCYVSPSSQLLGKKVSDIDPECQYNVEFTVFSADIFLKNKPDVVIDFSTPSGTMTLADEMMKLKVPLVIGTTGLTKDQESYLHGQVASHLAVIHAMNFSLGVNLMFRISADIARALGDDYNIEISEIHHNKKIDSPSGTAIGLAKHVCEAKNQEYADVAKNGRCGQVGKRSKTEIGIHALRMGNVVGEHTIHFGNDYERIEFTHRAQDRDLFAAGALRAAKWLSDRGAGFYTMQDVLFG